MNKTKRMRLKLQAVAAWIIAKLNFTTIDKGSHMSGSDTRPHYSEIVKDKEL